MLVHFDSNLSFNSTCIKRGKRTLLYGREYALELDCVYGDEDAPLDIQALGCESWRLSIYKSHSTPSELLLRKDYAENMAVGNRIIIDFATTTRPMYEYMAGSPCAPILFELYGYNDGESLPTVSLQFLMTMRTTATYVQPRPVRDNANDGVLTLINGDTYTQFSANSASDVTVDVTPKLNAYADLSDELLPYLYAADYATLDYKYAYSWFAQYNEAAPVGACSSIRSGGLFGRNYDWVYSEMAEFIVSTHAAPGRHAVVGMANAKDMLTRSIVESREYSDVYRVLPFMLVDGINDAGLVCNVNVVPLEGASTEATVPTGELERSLNSGMLVRFLLDKFDNAHDAAMYVREHCAVTMSKSIADMGYAPHFMLADEQHTYLLEFVDREAVVTCMDDGAGTNVAGNPFMTNFLLHGVALNEDGGVYTPSDVAEDPAHNPETVNGIAADGSGLERYNMLCAAHAASGTVEGMLQTMKDIRYTYAYDLDKGLYTEFAGMDGLTCGSSAEDYLASGVVRLTVDAFNHRSRNPRALTYGTWQTVHTSVYDISNRTMSVYCQEDYDRSMVVRCGGSGESDVKAVQEVLVDGESVVSGGTAGIPRMSTTVKGVAALGAGLTLTAAGALCVSAAGYSDINARVSPYKPVAPSNLDYSVRSVSPLITSLPSDAASPIALTDASATTRNHSYTYTHAPSTAPTYQLPAVTDSTISHQIDLTVTFSASALSCAFVDSLGNTIAPKGAVVIAAGSIVNFLCEYVAGGWVIYALQVKE